MIFHRLKLIGGEEGHIAPTYVFIDEQPVRCRSVKFSQSLDTFPTAEIELFSLADIEQLTAIEFSFTPKTIEDALNILAMASAEDLKGKGEKEKNMNKYWQHFKTITKHKWIVMKLCFKCGQYKRGLLHDLSKYGVTEFASSARYFTGTRSPIDVEKEVNDYSIAWQHHKGHNPHHWEYWIDNVGTYKNTPCRIPYEYVVEMICDWVGAGIVYSKQKCDFTKPYKEPFDYYKRFIGERIFHPETQELIEYFLSIIQFRGVNAFCEEAKDYSSDMVMNYLYIP